MSRNHLRLNARRWAQVRRAAFDRDGYRCTVCGKAGRLEAHHEPPLRDGDGGDPYDLSGILTYCRSCHIQRHRGDDLTPGRLAWIEFVGEITGET